MTKKTKKEKKPEFYVLTKEGYDVLLRSEELLRELLEGGLTEEFVRDARKAVYSDVDTDYLTLRWFLDNETEHVEALGYTVLSPELRKARERDDAVLEKRIQAVGKDRDRHASKCVKLEMRVQKLTEQLAAIKAKSSSQPRRVPAAKKKAPARKEKQLPLPLPDGPAHAPGQE